MGLSSCDQTESAIPSVGNLAALHTSARRPATGKPLYLHVYTTHTVTNRFFSVVISKSSICIGKSVTPIQYPCGPNFILHLAAYVTCSNSTRQINPVVRVKQPAVKGCPYVLWNLLKDGGLHRDSFSTCVSFKPGK